MLNELAALSASLKSRGIQPQTWHPWIQPFKKGEAVIAELGETGTITRISSIAAEEVATLRNIAPDFHNSFPGFNLNCPVLALADGTLWNQPEALWERALAATLQSPLAWEMKDLRRLGRLIGDFPTSGIAPRLRGEGPKLLATVAMLQRLAQAKPEPQNFLHQLSLQVVAAAQEGRLSREMALSVLYGKPDKKKLRRGEWKTTLILDVSDLDKFPYRIADSAVPPEWSRLLVESESVSSRGAETFLCGLTGLPDSPMGEKMPNPYLDILGPTILMSMNRDIPCQTRYGQTSTSIFPVGETIVQDLSDALVFITDPVRRQKTWAGVPNGSKDQSDLLIAYLKEEPDSDVPVAGFFADVEPNAEQDLATYETRTAHIHDALRLREKAGKDSKVTVIALSKIDKGRAQVLFNASYSAAEIYAGRDRWLSGAKNIPEIAIPLPAAKGKPAVWRSAYKPSPSEVMTSFKRQWLRAGQTYQTVPGVDLSSIYALLLAPEAGKQASWLLDRYLKLTEPLVIGLARSLSGGAKILESARKDALVSVAIYGILLLRQGRTKEIYMKSRDYLIGQFLQMADLLHRLYCVHERKGSTPPQLIGNAAISTALQSPQRALQVLGNRIPVYVAWADRYQGEGAGLAKWSRGELGRLSALLKDEKLDSRVSASGRAELLLGYLASTKQKENEEKSL